MFKRTKVIKPIEWYQWLLSLMIFGFCFIKKSVPIFVSVILLYLIYLTVKRKVKFEVNKTALGFIILFLAYVIGTVFTDHLNDAIHSLERKLAYVLFPLMFFFQFPQKLNLKPIIIAFILGVCVCSVLGLVNSYFFYLEHGDFNNSFGSTTFSYIHHPTYFSAFLVTAFLLSMEGMKRKWRFFNVKSLVVFYIFTATMQFFCFSFAGLIFLFIISLGIIYRYIFFNSPTYLFIISLISLPIIPVGVYYSNIHIRIEIDEAFSDLGQLIYEPVIKRGEQEVYSGNELRLILWKVSIEEIIKNPLGAGTANLDDKIGTRLRSYGLPSIANQNYNPHNQYLQIAVEIGVLGLLVFLSLFYFIIKYSIKHRNILLFLIALNLLFNCLFESMLQRESGIVFYTFWLCLLLRPNIILGNDLVHDGSKPN